MDWRRRLKMIYEKDSREFESMRLKYRFHVRYTNGEKEIPEGLLTRRPKEDYSSPPSKSYVLKKSTNNQENNKRSFSEAIEKRKRLSQRRIAKKNISNLF